MSIQNPIKFAFPFEDRNINVRRSYYSSVEDYKSIADAMLVDGRYSADLAREFDIPEGQIITNSFRKGSTGIWWMLKRILEDNVTPHSDFWRHEVGRDVEAELNKRGWTRPDQGEIVQITPEPIAEPIAASESVDKPEPVETEEPQPEEKRWSDVLKEQVGQIERRLDKIESYDRGVAWVKDVLKSREAENPNGVMADTLRLVLEAFEAE